MPMTIEEVLTETRRWPGEQVEVLLGRLVTGNYRLPEPAVDEAWAREIKSRVDDIESGREKGVSGEETIARVRKIVGL